MEIPKCMLAAWKRDDKKQFGAYSVYEDTTFAGIMSMGTEPIRTCMDYKDGMYRECLLSYFDGNKKIVYLKENGKLLARAVIRLTKMADGITAKRVGTLDFTDVSEENGTLIKRKKRNSRETSVIFLERCYSGVQDDATSKKRTRIESALIRFVYEKAREAGCQLLVSGDYGADSVKTAGLSETMNQNSVPVFITKSKAGKQYLDSFGGAFSNRMNDSDGNENTYVKTTCYVPVEWATEAVS